MKWSLTRNIQSITTNDAFDVVLGDTELCEHLKNNFEENYEDDVRFHNQCIAHAVHLPIKEGMGEINNQISSFRSVISSIHPSVKQRDNFL